MRLNNKILAFFLVPVIFLSITGATIHLHFCGYTGQIFSNIHFVSDQTVETGPCCKSVPEQDSGTCGFDQCSHNEQSECCIDYSAKIVTDKIYLVSVLSNSIQPAELKLYQNSHHDYFLSSKERLIQTKTNSAIYLNPYPKEFTELLL